MPSVTVSAKIWMHLSPARGARAASAKPRAALASRAPGVYAPRITSAGGITGVAFEQLGDKPLRPSRSSSNLRIEALEAENRTLRDQNTLLKAKLSSGAGDQALQAKVWRLERELEAALGGAEAVKKRAHVPHMR